MHDSDTPSNNASEDAKRDKDHKPADRRTIAAQAGGKIYPPFNEIVQPISMATTYERAADNTFPGGAIYSRADNPVFSSCESLLCTLETGNQALLFGSGMAAASAVFQTMRPGMRVVAPRAMYWGLRAWLIRFARQWQLELDLFDVAGDKPADVAGTANLAELLKKPADLVWIETPANPCWDITDIAASAKLAHQAGARLVVDSTVATPVFSQPLSLGADIVMHSATKALNGHSDVVAGALITRTNDSMWEQIRSNRSSMGAIAGPFEAWLLLRGMRTLFPRVEAASASAMQIAKHFQGHRAISQLLYPGLTSHPGHQIAAAQMLGGFGTMLSIRCRGGAQAAIQTAARVQLFKRATSLGSTESLIEHRASVEGEGTECPDDLLRLSVGIESTADLISDIEQAL